MNVLVVAYATSAPRNHRFRDVSYKLSANGKKDRRHKSSLCAKRSPPLAFSSPSCNANAYEKLATPYFSPRSLENVDEAEEKVASAREMFCPWIIIPRHNGIGYNITDDIMWLGDGPTAGNQFSRSPRPLSPSRSCRYLHAELSGLKGLKRSFSYKITAEPSIPSISRTSPSSKIPDLKFYRLVTKGNHK